MGKKKYRNEECKHTRIKKNFPFGRHSQAKMHCKDCKKPLSKLELQESKFWRTYSSRKRK